MAFEILARLGLNATGFQSGMRQAESASTAFASKLKTAFSVAAVGAFAKSIINAADRIGDLTDQTGLAVDQIQELIAIAGKSGLEFTVLQQFIERLREARREAIGGKKDFESIFSQVGIDLEELSGMKDPGELLQRFSRGFSQFNEESRNAIATAIGGTRAGPKLSSTLKDIGSGTTSGELKFTKSEVDAASQADEFFKSMGRQIKVGVFRLFQSPEGPAIDPRYQQAISTAAQDAVKEAVEPIKQAAEKVFQPPINAPAPEKEKEGASAPSPREFRQDVNALQRIGAEVVGNGGEQLERRQLEIQMKMEQHLKDIKNNQDSTYG